MDNQAAHLANQEIDTLANQVSHLEAVQDLDLACKLEGVQYIAPTIDRCTLLILGLVVTPLAPHDPVDNLEVWPQANLELAQTILTMYNLEAPKQVVRQTLLI